MKQSRIVIAAAAAAVGALFAAPAVTAATPFAPNGLEAVNTAAKASSAVEQAAFRRVIRHRVVGHWRGHPWWWRHRFARCWNCRPWVWRHRHGGPPFFLSFGYPYYPYPYYPYGYYPYYGWGPAISFGFRIH